MWNPEIGWRARCKMIKKCIDSNDPNWSSIYCLQMNCFRQYAILLFKSVCKQLWVFSYMRFSLENFCFLLRLNRCFSMLHGEAHMHIMIEDVLIFQQDNLSFPLICPDWNADEEMLLLEGIEMYGFGNWTEVSEHVGTRRRQQCIDHYNAIYMNSPCFPLPVRPVF